MRAATVRRCYHDGADHIKTARSVELMRLLIPAGGAQADVCRRSARRRYSWPVARRPRTRACSARWGSLNTDSCVRWDPLGAKPHLRDCLSGCPPFIPPRLVADMPSAGRNDAPISFVSVTPDARRIIAVMRRNYPRTLGSTARADLLLRTWCNNCRHWVDVDPGEQAARYGADLPVLEWRRASSARNAAATRWIASPARGVPAGSIISPSRAL